MRAALIAFATLTLSCAPGPRAQVARAIERGDIEAALGGYERLRASEGADGELLARVAALVLQREAGSADERTRRAAVQQLALAGTAGLRILERLATSKGPAALTALEALARRGQPAAKAALRALAGSEEPAHLAAAVLGMEPEADRDLLLALARSPHAPVRANALAALSSQAEAPEVRALLIDRARRDPAPRARAAAIRALDRAAAPASETIRERLGDPDPGVRMAAAGVLAADPSGRHALAPLFHTPPSLAGIEAARVLLSTSPPELALADEARTYLMGALNDAPPQLRGQAAIALVSLPAERAASFEPLSSALESETDPNVRLAFARALRRHDGSLSRAALEQLLDAAGMPRVQAAALLAEDGHAEARAVLSEVLASGAPSILRRTAARALARDARRPDAVRRALLDPDPLVRVYAAGGVLSATVAD